MSSEPLSLERDVWRAIDRLTEAQTHTDERLAALVAVQTRSEERLAGVEDRLLRVEDRLAGVEDRLAGVERTIGRLAEVQTRTQEHVQALTEAQTRTEHSLQQLTERVDGLAASLQQLTERVDALAEAQTRTERTMQQLQRQVGGLSETIGGSLEDIAYIVLHDVLKRDFGWEVGPLERSWQRWDDQAEEVDVFGGATDPAHPDRIIWIVGEAKHNLTLREVMDFARKVERARRHLVGEIFPVCFCYRARPEVQQAVRAARLYLVFCYGKLVEPAPG